MKNYSMIPIAWEVNANGCRDKVGQNGPECPWFKPFSAMGLEKSHLFPGYFDWFSINRPLWFKINQHTKARREAHY